MGDAQVDDYIENIFDINKILSNSYIALKNSDTKQNIEFIFDMDTTVPRELRGNDSVFEHLFTTILTFINDNSHSSEVLVSLHAPKDFVFEELITIKMQNTEIPKEKILAFLETGLGNDLKTLEAKIVNDKEVDIHLEIPFIIGELGFRRHYRLPSKSMLDKKVLLISSSEKLGQCIDKMFKYFPYDVDIKQIEDNNDLSAYDILIADETLANEALCKNVRLIQETQDLKFVILGIDEVEMDTYKDIISTYLLKPVTQESIFELIISVFDTNVKNETNVQVEDESINVEDEDTTTKEYNSSIFQECGKENNTVASLKVEQTLILDIEKGLVNTQKSDMTYADALEEFLESFETSDLYFRQIASEKSTHKIKEFCNDLEKNSKLIGAEEMLKFTDVINLIVIYNKLDMLPIYPGKYHLELEKLKAEINKYLHKR